MLKKILLCYCLLFYSVIGFADEEEVFVLRLHHFLPASSSFHTDVLQLWAEKLADQSEGQLQIEFYPGMQLGGSPSALYNQVHSGKVDIVWTLLGYSKNRFPIASVFELPFIAASAEASSQAAYEFSQYHLKEELSGVHPLTLHAHSPGILHVRNKKVTQLIDLKDLRIRVPNNTLAQTLSALGADPIFMSIPQIPPAFLNNKLDGVALPYEGIRLLDIDNITRTHIELVGEYGLYTSIFLFAMNQSLYESLPIHLRTIIDKNSGVRLAQQIGKMYDAMRQDERAKLLAKGNKIIILSKQETQKWQDKSQTVIRTWVKNMHEKGHDGQALISRARQLVKKYSE